jgi:hypothetical protein
VASVAFSILLVLFESGVVTAAVATTGVMDDLAGVSIATVEVHTGDAEL